MMNFCSFFLIHATLTALAIPLNGAESREPTERYLLYDVYAGEGFNLRRDVYIRLANLVRLLRTPSLAATWSKGPTWAPLNWTLVLPPWSAIPHWNVGDDDQPSSDVGGLSWSRFFDLQSMHYLVPVMELRQFQRDVLGLPEASSKKLPSEHVDLALKLIQHFPASGQISGNTERTVNFCDEPTRRLYRNNYSKPVANFPIRLYRPFFERHHNVLMPMIADRSDCVSGSLEARWLAPFLARLAAEDPDTEHQAVRSIYLESAEAVIHGYWSEWSQEYWTARRSMVFARHLRQIGDSFRRQFLNSTDQFDRTVPPSSNRPDLPGWLQAKWPLSPAHGGPYLAVHWRRGDYVLDEVERQQGVAERTPSPELVAQQLLGLLRATNSSLDTVFLATDACETEVATLVEHLKPFRVVRFHGIDNLDHDQRPRPLGQGELAIIDQWICAHARFFIGTNPSTFTFRITEERTIMGFEPASTFNTLCPTGTSVKLHSDDNSDHCEALNPWPMVVEPVFSRSFTSPVDQHGHQEL